MVSIFTDHHFLVIYYRNVEKNWMDTHIHRNGFLKNTDIFTCDQHKKEKRGRKLSLWTNESSPFSLLSLTLMGPPMLCCLPRIIKAAQAGGAEGDRNPFFYLCARVCLMDTPQGGCQQWVPQRAFFPLSAAKVREFK